MFRTAARSLFNVLLFSTILFAVTDGVNIISSSTSGLMLEFAPDTWQVEKIVRNSETFQSYNLSDCELYGETGQPGIPIKIITIGVPIGANVAVNVTNSEFETLNNINLLPIPEYQMEEDILKRIYNKNDSYQLAQYTPEQLVVVESPQHFRGYRTARIKIFPLQYNAATKQLIKYSSIRFQVSFSGSISPAKRVLQNDELAEKLLINYNQAKNWKSTPSVSLKKPKTVMSGENWYKVIIRSDGSGGKEGMYQLTGKALKDAGIDLNSIDVETVQLFNNGGLQIPEDIADVESDSLIENPIYVSDGSDGKLGESDYILFYGRSLEGERYDQSDARFVHYINPYSYENVYWLTFNQKAGKRMQVIGSESTAGLQPEVSFRDLKWIEEERYNIFNSGHEWLGHELSSDAQSSSYSVSFDLNNVVMSDSAKFIFNVAAASSGKHSYSFYANGNSLGSSSQWGGGDASYVFKESTFEATGVLMDGSNSISLSYSNSNDIAFSYVNWIELEYSKKFIAKDDILIFNTPLRDEIVRFNISGFSGLSVLLFDVTDVENIMSIAPAQDPGSTIDFAVQCSSRFSRRLIAINPDKFKNISLPQDAQTTFNDLRVTKNVDYIIISHRNYLQQAQELESLREDWSTKSRYETEVVDYQDVINQFGCGIADPGAIRNFLAYAQDNWGNPAYVLLIGDGHFDYKDILNYENTNFIVPYETGGKDENLTRTTDDWFTYTRGEKAGMQMAIGRLPAKTIDDARNIVDKIIAYETKPEYGEWLKTITIVGDDDLVRGGKSTDNTLHTDQANNLADNYVPELLDVKKIILFNYPAVSNPSVQGVAKPTATLDLLDQINRGTLLLNFVGHGNDELWTHERILLRSRDYDAIQNGNRTALWVAATCEFAHWDQANEQSFAEDILFMKKRGAVGMISSARIAYTSPNATFNYRFYKYLFDDYIETGISSTIGDAVLLAKANSSDKNNNEKYAVFGDPVMRLCAPRYQAVVDSISPNSIQALAKMKITGHVEKNDALWGDYNGTLNIRVRDTRKQVTNYYYPSENKTSQVSYQLAGNTLFRGVTTIENGQFSVELIVPKDISYGGEEGSISIYFHNDNTSGTGVVQDLVVGGTAVNLVDNDGPDMQLNFGDPNYQDGDYVSTSPVLHLEIADSLSGINTAGDLGHQIMMTVDEDFDNSLDITEYFTYSEGSYTTGTLNYPIYDMEIGEHQLQVKAWDNSNNSSIVETQFIVLDDSEFKISKLLTFPNPMVDDCSFRFQVSQDAQVEIKIYTITGRMLEKFAPFYATAGYNIAPETWDGTDDAGDRVANGVYLYKVIARTEREGKKMVTEKINKIIIAQ